MTQFLRATFIFGFFLVMSLAATGVNAQSPEEAAKKYGITFPVNDLGNCVDYAACRTYCDDPVNNTECTEFAKKKGFYKEENLAKEEFIKAAKDDLGCDTTASCMTFCDDPKNYDKCNEFAKKLQITGGYLHEPDKQEIIEKAKSELGCNSYGSCVSYCFQEENKNKCASFAQEAGLRGGIGTKGPGGCNSEVTCKAYCLDPNNFNQCSKFAGENGRESGKFKGPGGCDSPESCRDYCEKNPESCRSYGPGANGRYVPIACPSGYTFGPGGACTPVEKVGEATSCAQSGNYWNGQSCSDQVPTGITTVTSNAYFQPRQDMGSCSTPGSCYDWCKANPGKCVGFNSQMPRPDDSLNPGTGILYNQPSYSPKQEMGGCTTPGSCYDWCKANLGKCSGFNPDSARPTDNISPNNYPANSTGPGLGSPALRPSTYSAPSNTYTQPKPDMGGCTTAGSCYDWCKANPGKCGGFNPDSTRPSDNYNYQQYQPSSGTTNYQPSTNYSTPNNYYQAPTNYVPPSTAPSTSYTAPTNYTSPSNAPAAQPAESSQPQPAPVESQPAPMDTTSTQMPTVQGISTNIFKGVMQSIYKIFGLWK